MRLRRIEAATLMKNKAAIKAFTDAGFTMHQKNVWRKLASRVQRVCVLRITMKGFVR